MRQGRPRLSLRGFVIVGAGVALAAAGYAVGSAPLCGVGAALLLIVIVDWLHVMIVDAHQPLPSLSRIATPNPGVAGETATVILAQPPNSKARLDQGTGLNETLPDDLAPSMRLLSTKSKDPGVFSITYQVTFPSRGRWTVGPYTTTRLSPIGLWSIIMADTVTKAVIAWPRTVPMDAHLVISDHEGRSAVVSSVQANQDNVSLREYSPGDDLRRIHWRSSAKRGELMTRLEEPMDSDHVWIGLVVAPGAVPAIREQAVSLAACLCRVADEARMPVELALGSTVHTGPLPTLMNELAWASAADVGAGLSNASPQGVSLLVAARSATHGLNASSLVRAPRNMTGNRRDRCWAVVLSNSDQDVATVEALGWRAIQIGADTSLEDAAHRVSHVMQGAAV